ncbi:MAG: nucleotidyltransferase domain-containing protein, partial [Pseudomonadota bacterium]
MTLPLEALAPASEPLVDPYSDALAEIGLNPVDVLASDTLFVAIRDAAADLPAAEVRKLAVSHIRDANKAARARIAGAIALNPLAARPAMRAYCYLTDEIVKTVFRIATEVLHRNPNPTEGERISVVAVGGYGRGEMAPFSDVDLLFLVPWKVTPWAESLIESMLYIFWDLHLKIGHASRNLKECLRLGRDDYTIRTALLEQRFLVGDAALAEELENKLKSDLFRDTGADFIEAKLQERNQRHKRQGGQRYMVEPNVKEGKGGLRDLQTLFWIGKYVNGVDDAAALVDLGVFREEEYNRFLAAETFLMAVRCHLHLIANRASDQLTFDSQVETAARMGYIDKAGRRAVEHFMQDYFRHATVVGELTRIFLTALEAQHVKKAPSLVTFFKRRRSVKDGYKVRQNRLDIARPKTFFDDPLNILRIFEEALRTGYLIHPDAMRQVTAHLGLIDDTMRKSPEATAIFIDLLLKHGNPERALRRMNELGVLAAFLPEFAPVVAMMQFNMYHHYTVDEHTIQCISTLAQ